MKRARKQTVMHTHDKSSVISFNKDVPDFGQLPFNDELFEDLGSSSQVRFGTDVG